MLIFVYLTFKKRLNIFPIKFPLHLHRVTFSNTFITYPISAEENLIENKMSRGYIIGKTFAIEGSLRLDIELCLTTLDIRVALASPNQLARKKRRKNKKQREEARSMELWIGRELSRPLKKLSREALCTSLKKTDPPSEPCVVTRLLLIILLLFWHCFFVYLSSRRTYSILCSFLWGKRQGYLGW